MKRKWANFQVDGSVERVIFSETVYVDKQGGRGGHIIFLLFFNVLGTNKNL